MNKYLPLAFSLLLAAAPARPQAPSPDPSAPAPAPEQAPAATFGETVKATAVTVTIDVRDAAGKVPADLSPGDLRVLEDGEPMPVLAVERVAASPGSAAPTATGPELMAMPAPRADESWQLVVYFDSSTASTPSVHGAARELAARAAELVGLGTVEIVVADPAPERVFGPSRDAAALRTALEKVSAKGKGANLLAQIRREFVASSDSDNLDELNRGARMERPRDRAASGTGPTPGSILYRNEDGGATASTNMPSGASAAQRQMLIRTSVQREGQLLARQRVLLLDWLALTQRPRRPRALLLVSDGFDVDPGEFYLSYLRDASLISALQSELAKMGEGPAFEQMVRTVAASGWQVVAISFGQPGAQSAAGADQSGRGRYRGFTGGGTGAHDATGSGLSGFLLRAPIDPLRTAATETGGELALAPDQLGAAVGALGERVRLTYQVPRDPDGALHALAVSAVRAGLTVRAPRTVAAAAPDALMAARVRHVMGANLAEGVDFAVTLTATARPDARRPDALDVLLDLRADLAPLAAERARLDAGDLRVTLAVELPDGRILISQERPKPRDLTADRSFVSREPLLVPRGVKRIAVAVDDVESGAWGAAATTPKQ